MNEIKLVVNGQEMTLDEARELYDQLRKLFGSKQFIDADNFKNFDEVGMPKSIWSLTQDDRSQ
jgi:predicted mannosyl-3-phosphoglycerate phosphatase (HAD superfamily)